MSMATGARQLLTQSFDATESLRSAREEQATILYGFDTHFKDLLHAYRQRPRDTLEHPHGHLATGMLSSIPVAREARTLFGNSCPAMDERDRRRRGPERTRFLEEQCVEASGYPAPDTRSRSSIRRRDTNSRRAQPGEILVRGYMVMQGYYRKPEETAKAIDENGWMHSGDMGFIRADGHLRLMGRYKDMLKIGGENVDPLEVEAYLGTHPAIKAAAVVGVPDARLSEVAVAFLQTMPGQRLTEREVAEHCRGRIASYKIPRHVFLVEEFPMTGSGKVQKSKLREEARRRLGTG